VLTTEQVKLTLDDIQHVVGFEIQSVRCDVELILTILDNKLGRTVLDT
jgi:hypothetical protein